MRKVLWRHRTAPIRGPFAAACSAAAVLPAHLLAGAPIPPPQPPPPPPPPPRPVLRCNPRYHRAFPRKTHKTLEKEFGLGRQHQLCRTVPRPPPVSGAGRAPRRHPEVPPPKEVLTPARCATRTSPDSAGAAARGRDEKRPDLGVLIAGPGRRRAGSTTLASTRRRGPPDRLAPAS